MLIKIIIIVFIFFINFYFIRKSNRKRRYGLIPGWISISLTTLVGISYFIIIITSTQKPIPEMSNKKKGESALNQYQEELQVYMQHYNEREKKISTYLKFVDYLYFSAIVQFSLSWILGIYGLVMMDRRKLFYTYITIAYTIALLAAIFGKNIINYSSY